MRITHTTCIGLSALLLAAGCYQPRHSTYRTYGRVPVVDETAASADRALADLVRAQFNHYGDLATLTRDINISARNGRVTLAGGVPNSRDHRMILAVVENTPGVTSLDDQLRIANSTTRVVSPSDTTVIYPTGRLGQPGRVVGDSGDMFNLHVQGLSDTDRTLAQRVLDGLRTDAVSATMLPVVNINVADGRVILRGTVANEDQRRTIVSAVQRAAGVNNVFDELQVQYPAR